ncbi:hypothetical protein [Streptomyces sp. NBC_01443]|uniref:hypothetical protein n=1 Tax=Streptomyces sp. NBC_01443 TaxID=2903868 RepID=UPI002B1CB884|nr:hypothetical protein [Streptomyces sp. NBC_01443]
MLAALNNTDSELALVRPAGTHTVVLTGKDGLSGPTSVAVRHHRVYVPGAAFLTGVDPNLPVADVGKNEKSEPGKNGKHGKHED